MKIFLESVSFINKAPFDKIKLDFKQSNINVLTSVNGKGKTTILSHIVDSWVEIAKGHYNLDTSFYRTSSSLYNLQPQNASIVYIRYKIDDVNFDFLEINGNCDEAYYNKLDLEDKIPFTQFQVFLKDNNFVKRHSSIPNNVKVSDLFSNNIITYFPAYRYEEPSYLTDIYKIKTEFNKKSNIKHELLNPLEILTNSNELANWILDILLDKLQKNNPLAYNPQTSHEDRLFNNLSQILTQSLSSKNQGNLKLGIGNRNNGGTRLQIHKNNGSILYPSIFGMSSGEISIFSIFAEILKQSDKIYTNFNFQNIKGIVLVDEIDKHLHIKLQKEALPKLLKLFPNVQFIITSHSPFLNMGLSDELEDRTQIIDLDNNGVISTARNNSVYTDVYELFTNENTNFKRMLDELKSAIPTNSIPLIITEGKTDVKHLQVAAKILDLTGFEFYEINEDWGDSKLKALLENISKIKNNRIIIGIFDRDDAGIVRDIENVNAYKTYSDEVYALCIPLQNEDKYGDKISIEHYYPIEILLKEDANGRRLFLGSEFFDSSNSKDGNYQTKTSKIQNKISVNGIIDEKVFKREDLEMKKSLALTKNDFADLIENKEFNNHFDFLTFQDLFNQIKKIIELPKN